jgi:hypothetical protein
MIKYEVVKGHVMDLKAREGHISEYYQMFEDYEEAETIFIRTQASMRKENEYTALNRVEIDETITEHLEVIHVDNLETVYMFELLETFEKECQS